MDDKSHEYMDKNKLVEYLDITEPMYYHHRLWEKIPNVKFGKTRIYKKEVVDWYMLLNSADEVKDDSIHTLYQKYPKVQEKAKQAAQALAKAVS